MYGLPTNLNSLMVAIRARVAAFLFVFFLTFTLGYLFLSAFGAVPDLRVADVSGEFTEEQVEDEVIVDDVPAAEEVAAVEHVYPLTLQINKLNRTLPINNPTSRAVADLDASLLSGVVRHPDSAVFGQEGNMLILGHSSYLPTVNNRFFKAFNGIQDLEWGDTITVTSADRRYVYQVENVYMARAQEVSVPIAATGARLTLATCDSFGTKDDRHIVEAKLLYSEPLPPSV